MEPWQTRHQASRAEAILARTVRAVAIVLTNIEQTGEWFGVVIRIARHLGSGPTYSPRGVRQADVDGGQR